MPSKKQTPFSVWYGTGDGRAPAPPATLKEADAFQRLVFESVQSRQLSRFPQRSRRLSASGMRSSLLIGLPRFSALKEADAFQRLVSACASLVWLRELPPSKKQTPFSVWYRLIRHRARYGLRPLKEADAFQRLVFVRNAEKEMRRERPSKKQTPFSVWYRREWR